ncbi:MAG: aquaporin [Phyllobacteriaceae bacterium]|jgi:glycerol uptake facilitator protein|nr:aquaporin [Phyllobacteriaceae bacterium]
MTPFLGELIGTMLLVIFGDGVVAGAVLKRTKSENGGWVVITLAWGLAVTLAIYAVGNISGAHINPAVTLALASTGDFPWDQVPSYILAQMLGGMIGAAIVWLHYLPHWSHTEDQAAKLAVFCTGPAVRAPWANLLSEVSGTFILVTGLLFIGANDFAEGLNPIVVGALIVAIGMSLGGTTGYAINPARDLAPRIAHWLLPIAGKGPSDWAYAPIPVVGPLLGGVAGACFYLSVFKNTIYGWMWAVGVLMLAVIVMALLKTNDR